MSKPHQKFQCRRPKTRKAKSARRGKRSCRPYLDRAKQVPCKVFDQDVASLIFNPVIGKRRAISVAS
jgi:hypothetical protein